jgi:hypothetical protein
MRTLFEDPIPVLLLPASYRPYERYFLKCRQSFKQ